MKTIILLSLIFLNIQAQALTQKESIQLLNKSFGYVNLELFNKLKSLNKSQTAQFILNYSEQELEIGYQWMDRTNFLMSTGFNCFMRRKYICDKKNKEILLKKNFDNFKALMIENNLQFRGVPNAQEIQLEDFRSQLVRGSGLTGRTQSKLYRLFQNSTLNTFIKNKNGFVDKMSLFFQNHFVSTLRESRSVTMMNDQFNLIRKYSVGNLKDLVKEITLDPAMLKYLDGDGNKCIKVDGSCVAPNENYARELMELFTLGVNGENGAGNCYTEKDIKNAAQALTGYSVDQFTKVVTFKKRWSDFDGNIKAHPKKPIFTQSCQVKGFDVIEQADSFVTDSHSLVDVLFARRGKQIARYITHKVLKEFIDPKHPSFQQLLETTQSKFFESNFELKVIYQEIFKSKSFYSDQNHLTHIRSPLEVFLSIYKSFSSQELAKIKINSITNLLKRSKQDLFNQPDVKGWRTGYDWIDTSSYTYRLEIVNYTFSKILPEICTANLKLFKKKVNLFRKVNNIPQDFKFKNCNSLNKLKNLIIGTDFVQKR